MNFELDDVLELSDDVELISLSPSIQRARAPWISSRSEVSRNLAAAATHAVVIKNREFDNSEGWLVRHIRWEFIDLDLTPADQVCQALQILSGEPVGYAQVCVVPDDWADDWTYDLPPIGRVRTVTKYPPRLNDRGWDKEQPTVSRSILDELPGAYSALAQGNRRAQLAARRLFQANLRQDRDDILLDACIGIEALVGQQRDELTHRMGLRVAVALTSEGVNPTVAYDALKKLYGHRSKIVHGSEPSNATITLSGSDRAVPPSAVATWCLRSLLRSYVRGGVAWTPDDLDERLLNSLVASPDSGDDAAMSGAERG